MTKRPLTKDEARDVTALLLHIDECSKKPGGCTHDLTNHPGVAPLKRAMASGQLGFGYLGPADDVRDGAGTGRGEGWGSGSIGTKSLQLGVSATTRPVEWAFPGRASGGSGGAPAGRSGSRAK